MLLNRALAIREKALGLEHPGTATSVNNLGGLYAGQGRYAEAELLYHRALTARTEESLLSTNYRTSSRKELNELLKRYDMRFDGFRRQFEYRREQLAEHL